MHWWRWALALRLKELKKLSYQSAILTAPFDCRAESYEGADYLGKLLQNFKFSE